ncbi:MAG: beta-ketoacyl-ACP synthase III [Pseudomonadota bacterium]
MQQAVISGTGLYTPPHSITNAELVAAFNAYVEAHNAAHAEEIASGEMTALEPSSVEFIEKASGIKSRFVVEKDHVLDPEVMAPRLNERPDTEISVLAEMAVAAARDAMKAADVQPADIEAVICACSNMQRPYPAMAVEIQDALGIDGFGFDMNVACASATFGVKTAVDFIANGGKRVLVVNPEICSGHLNFRDRDSHFIFGDVATAVVVEAADAAPRPGAFEVVGCRLKTVFSNNIRNNFGFLNRTAPEGVGAPDKLFRQHGRQVFKEVCPMVADMLVDHMKELDLQTDDLARLWLHQANIHMNVLIAKRVLGREPSAKEAPVILDEYANTSSAGSIIAFHKYREDLKPGDVGVICAFGAGYSAGSVFVRRAA